MVESYYSKVTGLQYTFTKRTPPLLFSQNCRKIFMAAFLQKLQTAASNLFNTSTYLGMNTRILCCCVEICIFTKDWVAFEHEL